MTQVVSTVLGPADDGTRMRLSEFRDARGVPGYSYELACGVVSVVDVPGRPPMVLLAIDAAVAAYRARQPDAIVAYLSGADAKIELPRAETERHPDRSVYLTPMPTGGQLWSLWTPTIAIEVVSVGDAARHRDFVEKRSDYLAAGVLEYWIFDPVERIITALRRAGDSWLEERLDETGVLTTHLLPGFELSLRSVFPPAGA